MQQELLTVRARNFFDFSGYFDVFDSQSGQLIGTLKREGWQSLIRDQWTIMDPQERPLGSIMEDSSALALLRRFLVGWIPRTFHAEISGLPVCTYTQSFLTFFKKLRVDFTADPTHRFDRRLGIAALILLHAVERREDRTAEEMESSWVGGMFGGLFGSSDS
jgi:hypothetical protein